MKLTLGCSSTIALNKVYDITTKRKPRTDELENGKPVHRDIKEGRNITSPREIAIAGSHDDD